MDQSLAWETIYKGPSSPLSPNDAFLAFLATHYWRQDNLKFLDLGCGGSSNALFLASKGYEVTAVDYSMTACQKLYYNLLGQYKELIHVMNADATKLKFEPESFDCILAINIFDYLDLDEACTIARMARDWLKPNGRLFARMLAQDPPEGIRHRGIEWKIYSPQDMGQLFVGYDAQHRPETQYLEGLAVNNWIITATKEEIKLGDELKATRIYYQADKTETWNKLVVDRRSKLEEIAKLKIPHLVQFPQHLGRCAIVGAAPSIKDHIEELKIFKGDDIIISLNGAHEFLIKNGVIPNIHILFEIDLQKAEDSCGGLPHRNVYYYICSICDQSLFKQLEGYRRVLWHCFDEDTNYQESITRLFPNEPIIGGSHVTFFRALNVALTLGFKEFHVFGCDCSFEGENTHYDGYHNDGKEMKLKVAVGAVNKHRLFQTTPSLSHIASEFIRFCDAYQPALDLKVHGDGLLRHLHQSKYPDSYDMDLERNMEATQFLVQS